MQAPGAIPNTRRTCARELIRIRIIRGNANVVVGDIIRTLPSGSLSLAFLDPTGLHLEFETLRQLANARTDFLIFFPDHLDALRNWKAIYHGKPDSNLSKVLGTNEWEKRLAETPPTQWAQMLREVYIQQIRTLGYKYFDYERIALPNGRHLYILLYCCRDERGADFWRKISGKKPSGQTSFDFGE